MVLPVCLTVVPEAAQVALGGQLAVSLTLQNTSDREACYHLDVRGIPVDWYDLDQRRIALLPAASAQVLLTVHPRGGTVAAAGRYALTVQVTAEDDPALQAAAAVALTVRTASGVDMDVQPTDVAGRAATFRLTYHNHSPAPVAIALLAHDSEQRLRFRPEPAEPVVVPGDRAGSIAVHAVPKVRQLVGVPQAYGIVFRALPLWTMPESQAELVREARFTYVPYVRLPALARVPVWVRRVPVWTGALALVLLVLLLVMARDRSLAMTRSRTAGMRTPATTAGVRALRSGRPRAPAQGRTRGLSRPSIRRPTHTRRVRVAPPTTLYFAEGYTGLLHTNGRATFDESLVVQNTTPVTATVTITYLFQWGRPVVVTRRIGPHGTQRESVNADIGPDKIAAAAVSSAARLTAERIIRRVGARGLRLGASSTAGTASLGQTFYFAAGHTSPSVQEYLAVANPGRAAAHVRLTLSRVARAGAATARGPSGTFTVPAHRRATWHIGRNMWPLATTSGGLIVRSDQPIVVERVSYVGNGDGSSKYGATVSAHKS